MFERFAKGDVSIKMLAREFPTIRGRRFYPAQIHQALRKRIYTGDFDFDGVTYKGTYAPLVSRETWERVQAILDGRSFEQVAPVGSAEFTLTGLVHCGHCGCLMVGELKKGRYIYYHCTDSRGRATTRTFAKSGSWTSWRSSLKQLVIAPATLSWLAGDCRSSPTRPRSGAREQALQAAEGRTRPASGADRNDVPGPA